MSIMKKIIIITMFALVLVACTDSSSQTNNVNNPEICNDNVDNDFDGDIDCNDSDCRFNGACTVETCGNGSVEGGEECDGADLNSEACSTQGFTAGQLACLQDCTFDIAACENPDPLKIMQSGSRIKMRVGRSPVPDGSVSFNGWYDTQLGINCVWRKHADGSTRCLPEMTASVERWYLDAACTVRLAAFPADDDALQAGTQISMEVKFGVYGVYVVSGTHVGTVYLKATNGCWGGGSNKGQTVHNKPIKLFNLPGASGSA